MIKIENTSPTITSINGTMNIISQLNDTN